MNLLLIAYYTIETKSIDLLNPWMTWFGLVHGVQPHFQQYFSYIGAASFIGGEKLEYPEKNTDLL
jgi:hypothetical protein